jgi:hypothetical protein
MNLHYIEIDQAGAGDLEETQCTSQEKSQWCEDEWENRAMNP